MEERVIREEWRMKWEDGKCEEDERQSVENEATLEIYLRDLGVVARRGWQGTQQKENGIIVG